MKTVNPFFQVPTPTQTRYVDVPHGGTFTHNGTEFVRVYGGHHHLKGRKPRAPLTLLPNTLVVI